MALISRQDLIEKGADSYVRRWHLDAQSAGFMSELLPTLQNLYRGHARLLEVADIGARTAAGTRLLSECFSPNSRVRLKMNLTAIDIDDTYSDALDDYPHSTFLKCDIFDIEPQKYDLSICSHVIEHLPDPYGFILQMRKTF